MAAAADGNDTDAVKMKRLNEIRCDIYLHIFINDIKKWKFSLYFDSKYDATNTIN